MKKYAFLVCLGAVCAMSAAIGKDAPQSGHVVTARWNTGGSGGWDYLTVDGAGKRLFVTRSDHVDVLDLASGKSLGQVAPTNGVHGVALAPALGKGYASNGKGDSVTVFDLKTLATTATIPLDGRNPDAIVFDAPTSRIFTFNGHSNNASVIDARTEKPGGTISLTGKPEFAVSDGKGRIYVNIEDRGELDVIDARAAKVLSTWKLADCEDPSGLAFDSARQRLFSVCENGHLVVTDSHTGKHVATVAIGSGPDAVAYDAGQRLVFSSNGGDGTLTIIRQESADHYNVLTNLPTQHSARTLALDPQSHRVFLAAAEFEPLSAEHAPHQRPAMKPGTFTVLLVGAASSQ